MIKRDSQSYRVLALVAQSGECSREALDILMPQESYQKKVVLKLLRERLITKYENDAVQGYRLTRKGKELLLALDAERFSFYLADGADFNMRRSKLIPRLRQHRISEVLAFMENCNIEIFYDQKPQFFAAEKLQASVQQAFYLPKEVKMQEALTRKIISSRSVGVCLSETAVWICYSMNSGLESWYENIERRVNVLIPSMLRWQGIVHNETNALMFGYGMEQLQLLWENSHMLSHIRSSDFERFCYVPLNEKGQFQLRLMQDQFLYENLKMILSEDLKQQPEYKIINDGINPKGQYTLICFDMDLKRLINFVLQLRFRGLKGQVICFDFQEQGVKSLCEPYAELALVDFDAVHQAFKSYFE